MQSILLLLAVASIHLGIVIIPGPNFLVIVKNSLIYSRRAGIVTARGVAIGTVIYVVAGFLGFTALLSQSVVLFTIVKWIGVVYFIYVGLQLIRHARRTHADVSFQSANSLSFSDKQALRSGLLTMLSNVKSAFYFMFLFTTFLPAHVRPEVKLAIIIMIPTISFTWYSFLALTFSNQRVRNVYQKVESGMNMIFGAVWIALGLRLMSTAQE